jgi:ubiquinone/menaquinone biosynthesis C-methylase UbiE
MTNARFDAWPDRYDRWFDTPVGRLVRHYEAELLLELLDPRPGERILDVGCGTGIFTRDVLDRGALVTGIDLSVPMLAGARSRLGGAGFAGLCADMCALPFPAHCFDKVFSMTAIEFVAEAARAVAELDRVTRPGGSVVVTTLNSRSPWAEQRRQKGQRGHDLFQHIHFRSPDEMRALVPGASVVRTAIHFDKHDPVADIPTKEREGSANQLETGAFLAVRWDKA